MSERETNAALRVMIVDDNLDRGMSVAAFLRAEYFDPFVVMTDHVGLLREISDKAPDIIIIDMASPSRDLLESLAIMSHMNPMPVLMFSAEQDPDYINRAVEAGVTAYMVGDIEAAKVKPAIDVAMAQFRNFQQLKQQLHETQIALDDRNLLERAKSMLMKAKGVSESEAHEYIRGEAMKRRLKMTEVSKLLLDQWSIGTK
ncbi:MAG: response regulator NasT [Candidatus Azotimanducaceae bacterium]